MKKLLFIIFFIFFGLSIVLFFLNLTLLYWVAIWISYIFLTVIIFQRIRFIFLKDHKKVQGRVFEMFFFLFLFTASYSITLITANWFKEVMTIALIFSLIGAGYCGYMHYIDGLHSKDYTNLNKEKNKKK